ncbi:MAG: DUF1540 domain-containing protein [Sarcina ventriculi]|nr:DUF1540 domain-containing protein [Sarcina ventriculi]MBU5322244.1 DUF1540 domain-containing protein [Sarcina ventriculi]MCI5637518.1 DUF1540 domain-containing protein [Sarcina ventriculi]MDD7374111.1 DUF1540 domain-containing protein [Sarcina ventriculi]MDO4402962.1 DUF1540 domain-containing protein [Clostridiaceae bacterium]
MKMIKCTVSNCSHNKSEVCYADRINIGGTCSKKCNDTCCGSFLDKHLYSDLTNSACSNSSSEGSSPCDCIVCSVETCKFNSQSLCSLGSIDVSSDTEVQLYTQANCKSFENN